ncbi:hypothetical protein MC7420_4142 [Coleofasciculus chthonoplastes PCC 7420]|uniref:Uncharacterized protein n=1 Tax=Coleofasciculus chthonoplastes PCC 7420 TaxID=118168 RepID=B4VVC2_9CYAN|nr:hypothetical protein [Coleofasciculus chthonoplastes]EDX74157.1 hypothetical protein MC7420_4142 [Coleofasciculus chthonoplastes PCC 7420]
MDIWNCPPLGSQLDDSPSLSSRIFSIPLQGLGIGQQLAWLKTHR